MLLIPVNIGSNALRNKPVRAAAFNQYIAVMYDGPFECIQNQK